MKVSNQVPIGWKKAKLGDIADLVGGGTPSRKKPEYFTGDIIWLTPSQIPKNRISLIADSEEKITDEGLNHSSAKILPEGTVLMTSRASIGYIAIAGTEVTTNQGFASFICGQEIYNWYLAYWLMKEIPQIEQQATGTTFKEISKTKLKDFWIQFPTFDEQKRIVSKIEELFSQLDAGVAGLKRAQAELKRYRMSVLYSTFYKENNWNWSRIGDITPVRRGASPRPKGNPKYFGGTIPWIKISDVTNEKGKYLTQTVDTVTEEGAKKSKFLPKDSLILSICATVCVPKIITFDGCVHDGFVYFPKLPEYINTTFLYYFFEAIRPKIIQKNRQGMTQVNLNTSIVGDIEIPIIPLQYQEKIVLELEQKISIYGVIEKAINLEIQNSLRFRQSILKNAFQGNLV